MAEFVHGTEEMYVLYVLYVALYLQEKARAVPASIDQTRHCTVQQQQHNDKIRASSILIKNNAESIFQRIMTNMNEFVRLQLVWPHSLVALNFRKANSVHAMLAFFVFVVIFGLPFIPGDCGAKSDGLVEMQTENQTDRELF